MGEAWGGMKERAERKEDKGRHGIKDLKGRTKGVTRGKLKAWNKDFLEQGLL